MDESNQIATLAISRTKAFIRRLRIEYAVLLERIEARGLQPKSDCPESLQRPPYPKYLGESLNFSNSKSYNLHMEPAGVTSLTVSGDKFTLDSNGLRDPELPKRPSNAYLIFCEVEKERVRQQLEDDPDSALNDLSKTLTEEWKNLDDEARKPYYKLYEDDRETYQREMSIYSQRKTVIEDKEKQETEQNALKRVKYGFDANSKPAN